MNKFILFFAIPFYCLARETVEDFAYISLPNEGEAFEVGILPIAESSGFIGAVDGTHPTAIIGCKMGEYLTQAVTDYRFTHKPKALCMEIIAAYNNGPAAPAKADRETIAISDLSIFDRNFLMGLDNKWNFAFTNSYHSSMVNVEKVYSAAEYVRFSSVEEILADAGCNFSPLALSYIAPAIDYTQMKKSHWANLYNALATYQGGWMDAIATWSNSVTLATVVIETRSAYEVPSYGVTVTTVEGKTHKAREPRTVVTHEGYYPAPTRTEETNRTPVLVALEKRVKREKRKLNFASGWNVETGKFTQVSTETYSWVQGYTKTIDDEGNTIAYTLKANAAGVRYNGYASCLPKINKYYCFKVSKVTRENGAVIDRVIKYVLITHDMHLYRVAENKVAFVDENGVRAARDRALQLSGLNESCPEPTEPPTRAIGEVTTDEQREAFDLTDQATTSIELTVERVWDSTYMRFSPEKN